MSLHDYRDPIKILGAGPAGLTSAIVLAKSGRQVIVHEKQNDVGVRFNDDFQGLENWSVTTDTLDEIADMGIQIAPCCHPFFEAVAYNPRFVPKKVSSATPMFYLVKRGRGDDTLDTTLKRQALEAGAELRFANHADPQDVDIIATGPRGAHVIAAGMTFKTKSSDGAYIALNNDLAPKGYAYLLIVDGQATLATVLFERFSDAKQCLQLTFDKFSQLLSFDVMNEPRRWGGYGSFKIPKSAVQDGQLYVGEAAGFQDFLFGFGIRYAMVSGFLAARSILEGEDYDKLWQTRQRRFLKASLSNRLLYSRLGNLAANGLWLLMGNSSTPTAAMRWLYSWTLTRRLVYPLAKGYYKVG
jgi:flavin-dependent dehydrogenase